MEELRILINAYDMADYKRFIHSNQRNEYIEKLGFSSKEVDEVLERYENDGAKFIEAEIIRVNRQLLAKTCTEDK